MKFRSNQHLAHSLGNTSNMKTNMAARQAVMERIPQEAKRLRRIKQCKLGQRCNQPECYHCAVPPGNGKRGKKPTHHDLRPVHRDWMPIDEAPCERDLPEVINPIRNFRNRGAQWMVTPFENLDLDHVFAVTIDHSVPSLNGNLSAEARQQRGPFQTSIKKKIPGAIYRGKFEFALKYADELVPVFPPELLQHLRVGSVVPHVLAALFHSHGILYAPGMNRDEVARVLTQENPGKNRVCVKHITETFEDEFGVERGGLWGWGQYCSKQRVMLDFGSNNIAAFEAALKLNRTWNGNSQNIKIGGPSKLDLRPTWLTEKYFTFDEAFMMIAKEEGWTDHNHPNFHLVIETPADAVPPEFITDDTPLIESPDELPSDLMLETRRTPLELEYDSARAAEQAVGADLVPVSHSERLVFTAAITGGIVNVLRTTWLWLTALITSFMPYRFILTNYPRLYGVLNRARGLKFLGRGTLSEKSSAFSNDPRAPP